jgi:hypothetical protein
MDTDLNIWVFCDRLPHPMNNKYDMNIVKHDPKPDPNLTRYIYIYIYIYIYDFILFFIE